MTEYPQPEETDCNYCEGFGYFAEELCDPEIENLDCPYCNGTGLKTEIEEEK